MQPYYLHQSKAIIIVPPPRGVRVEDDVPGTGLSGDDGSDESWINTMSARHIVNDGPVFFHSPSIGLSQCMRCPYTFRTDKMFTVLSSHTTTFKTWLSPVKWMSLSGWPAAPYHCIPVHPVSRFGSTLRLFVHSWCFRTLDTFSWWHYYYGIINISIIRSNLVERNSYLA